jgi:hypothetical protein
MEDNVFCQTVKRWRELGGLVAVQNEGKTVITESEDETTLRAASWLFFLRTDVAKGALDALPDAASTTVLKASACNGVEIAAPPKESWNVSSWGDWELKVERIPKQPGVCTSMLDLAVRELKSSDWDEYESVEVNGEEKAYLASMWDPRCALRENENASWDIVMDALGDEVSVEMFGATAFSSGTTVVPPQKIVCVISDGNEKIYHVDVGDAFYVCQVLTS